MFLYNVARWMPQKYIDVICDQNKSMYYNKDKRIFK